MASDKPIVRAKAPAPDSMAFKRYAIKHDDGTFFTVGVEHIEGIALFNSEDEARRELKEMPGASVVCLIIEEV